MNPFESQFSIPNEEKSLEERADQFALNQVGNLTEEMDPKQYWDDYYNARYEYLEAERDMERFAEESENRGEYEFFKYEDAREEVFKFSKSIAEYLKENDIKDLVIVDRSSRPLYVGVKEYWKDVFPDVPMPNIYFVNPKGFNSVDEIEKSKIQYANTAAYLNGDPLEQLDEARTKMEVMEEFKDVYPKLLKDKEKPILIFDTCIHSGDTLFPVTKTLEDLGFTNVRVGSVNPSDKGSVVKTDFYITEKEPEKGCYPFDKDRMIEKTFEHVYSKPTRNPGKRDDGNILRGEIKRIMREHLQMKNS